MSKWTKKRIDEAFTALVAEHGYENVTVAMIMERADVSKTTFYRYFRNKSDVMDGHYRRLYDAAFEDENCRTLEDLFTGLFRITREHPEELSMFDTVGYDSYRDFIYNYTYQRGKQIMEKGWGRPLTEKEDFNIAFFCGGGARILEEWVCGRYRSMTPEEAGRALAKIIDQRYRVPIYKK
ncbi:MAG: TetR/AcrR family transcriptional regulator [Erysipelotrichaceae bacterium]|nr:TetR/AcrR family transcriptional regulator [Erysipelotrichaceae bacterium]